MQQNKSADSNGYYKTDLFDWYSFHVIFCKIDYIKAI